jgi:TatA/E family protein of Tat protein translocase
VFGISGTELLIVGVFAFIIFGPDKIPEIMRTVNKAMKMFKSTQDDMEKMIKSEMKGIDPDIGSLFGMGEEATAAETPAAPKKQTSESGLQGIVDEEEEDEE